MNDQADFLKRLVKKLSGAGIPFMLVGSVAASYHGGYRDLKSYQMAQIVHDETKLVIRI
jgi:hypothetical protein